MLIAAASSICNLFLTCIFPIFIFFIAHASVLMFTIAIVFIQIILTFVDIMTYSLSFRTVHPQITRNESSRIRQIIRSCLLSLLILFSTLYSRLSTCSTSFDHSPNTTERKSMLHNFCPTVLRKHVQTLAEDPICAVCFDTIIPDANVHKLCCTHLFHSYVFESFFLIFDYVYLKQSNSFP